MKIKVYTTKTCVYCNKLKKFLDSENINYKIIDVADNLEEFMKLGVSGVPVTMVGDEVVVGYRPAEILQLVSKSVE